MNVRRTARAMAAATLGLAGALPAAALTIGSTAITSPIASTGFEGFTRVMPNVDYVDGGVVVREVGDEGAQPNLFFELSDWHGTGSYATIDETGYTRAALESGGTFNSFSGFFGSEGFGPDTQFALLFKRAGVTVGSVDNAGPLGTLGTEYSFSGFTADEVWFAGTKIGRPLGPNAKNRIGIDDLAFGVVSGGVPEPTSWALLILGFGLAGSAIRRRLALA